jgi:tellurite resistance protein TerC
MTHPWLWGGLFALILGAVAVDLGVHRHQRRPLSMRSATLWTLAWIAISLAYGGLVWWRRGSDAGTQFYTAWLLEKSLSFDNLVVFLLVFRRFQVADKDRHRVLMWGILGALVLRGAMIVGGIRLLAWWHPVVYLFGAFLAYSGVQTLVRHDDDGQDPTKLRWVRALKRVLHVPPLLFVLVVIELSDLMFAVDSIPAVLGVTRDLQIVFSSNLLALLGMRALYSVVEKLVADLYYLRYGIGAILILVGAKMCLDTVVHIPAPVSLAITVGILGVTAAASLIRRRRRARGPRPPAHAPHGARDAHAS